MAGERLGTQSRVALRVGQATLPLLGLNIQQLPKPGVLNMEGGAQEKTVRVTHRHPSILLAIPASPPLATRVLSRVISAHLAVDPDFLSTVKPSPSARHAQGSSDPSQGRLKWMPNSHTLEQQ